MPSTLIFPLEGLSKPVNRSKKVLFPDPDLPIIPTLDPIFIFKFKSFTADLVEEGKLKVISTPNRLVLHIKEIKKIIVKKSEEIRGPSLKAPEKALEGFIRANKIKKSQVFKKKTEKGNFYFFKQPLKKIKTVDLLIENIPKKT